MSKARITGDEVTFNEYIIVNPRYGVDTVFKLLSVHNKVDVPVIIAGTEADFAENPREVYRVVKKRRTLKLK